MSAETQIKRTEALLAEIKKRELQDAVMDVLGRVQGHGRGFDADMVDGKHAVELIAIGRSGGSSSGGGGGVSDHGALTGLDDPADHAWALLVDGSRAMTGELSVPGINGQGANFCIRAADDESGGIIFETKQDIFRTQMIIDSANGWAKVWLYPDCYFVPAYATGSLPTPTEDNRGAMIRVHGGEGVPDKLYCNMRRANGTYAWIQVATG